MSVIGDGKCTFENYRNLNVMADITDDYIIRFGDKRGQRIGDVSDTYLTRLYDTQKLSKAMRSYLENRIPILAVTARLRAKEKARKRGDSD